MMHVNMSGTQQAYKVNTHVCTYVAGADHKAEHDERSYDKSYCSITMHKLWHNIINTVGS